MKLRMNFFFRDGFWPAQSNVLHKREESEFVPVLLFFADLIKGKRT